MGEKYLLFLSNNDILWSKKYAYDAVHSSDSFKYYDSDNVGRMALLFSNGELIPCVQNQKHPFQDVSLEMIMEAASRL